MLNYACGQRQNSRNLSIQNQYHIYTQKSTILGVSSDFPQPTSVGAVALRAEVAVDLDHVTAGGHLVRLAHLSVELEVGDGAPGLRHRLRGDGPGGRSGRLGRRRPRRRSRHHGVRRAGLKHSINKMILTFFDTIPLFIPLKHGTGDSKMIPTVEGPVPATRLESPLFLFHIPLPLFCKIRSLSRKTVSKIGDQCWQLTDSSFPFLPGG